MSYPEWLYPAAWLASLAMSTLLFMYMHWRTGDARKSIMTSLLWLKSAALILWLVGLDRPVAAVYYIRGEQLYQATLTANIIITLALVTTNLAILAWPEISRALRGRREALPGVPWKA